MSKNTNVQTRYLQNRAYLRLKNIQLGYTLPVQWIQKAGISSVRVYVSGDICLRGAAFLLYLILRPRAIWLARDQESYPLQRVVSMVNVNFLKKHEDKICYLEFVLQ